MEMNYSGFSREAAFAMNHVAPPSSATDGTGLRALSHAESRHHVAGSRLLVQDGTLIPDIGISLPRAAGGFAVGGANGSCRITRLSDDHASRLIRVRDQPSVPGARRGSISRRRS
jgi:hypothetical protein